MRIVTVVVVLTVGLGVCDAQWMTQSSGTTGSLYAVSFSDSNNGTAVGGGYRGFPSEPYGLILRTTDGGQNWISQSSGTRFLSGVSFTDSSTGTVVGDSGTILRTTDGGQHWISQSSGTDSRLNAVSFTDANTGTVVGGHWYYGLGAILRTSDGGQHWVSQSYGTNIPLTSVSFTDSNNGTVVGDSGRIFRTTNGGQSWIRQSSGTSNWLKGVSFTDVNNGTAVGTFVILRTTDAGQNWVTQSTATVFYGVSFTDANNGTAVGGFVGSPGISRRIFRTTDGGQSWVSQVDEPQSLLYGVCFTDANNGTAVGADGINLTTRNGGVTFVEGTKIGELPSEMVLSQNYPNPFNPSTTIRYELPSASHVNLRMFDILGREVSVLVNERRDAGVHEVRFDGSNLASGVYFYRLQAGDFTQTKRLLLLR
jgi:photosystem II stability/assembly factor-like uncharacterized protein